VTRPVRLNDVVLLACQFEIVGEAAERAVSAGPAGDGPRDSAEGNTPEKLNAPSEPEDRPPAEDTEDDGVFRDALEVEGARIDYAVSIQGDGQDEEFVLIVHTVLHEPALPYELELLMGATYDTPEPSATESEAASTLLFMVYPYVRETIFSITGRSPYRAFQLPPLATLPHPRVTGQEVPEDEVPSGSEGE